jgi:hypothetical protein
LKGRLGFENRVGLPFINGLLESSKSLRPKKAARVHWVAAAKDGLAGNIGFALNVIFRVSIGVLRRELDYTRSWVVPERLFERDRL